jgi:hypothetical protein
MADAAKAADEAVEARSNEARAMVIRMTCLHLSRCRAVVERLFDACRLENAVSGRQALFLSKHESVCLERGDG